MEMGKGRGMAMELDWPVPSVVHNLVYVFVSSLQPLSDTANNMIHFREDGNKVRKV